MVLAHYRPVGRSCRVRRSGSTSDLPGPSESGPASSVDVLAVLGRARELLASVANAEVWQLPQEEVVSAIEAQARLDAAVAASRAVLVAAADPRQHHRSQILPLRT